VAGGGPFSPVLALFCSGASEAKAHKIGLLIHRLKVRFLPLSSSSAPESKTDSRGFFFPSASYGRRSRSLVEIAVSYRTQRSPVARTSMVRSESVARPSTKRVFQNRRTSPVSLPSMMARWKSAGLTSPAPTGKAGSCATNVDALSRERRFRQHHAARHDERPDLQQPACHRGPAEPHLQPGTCTSGVVEDQREREVTAARISDRRIEVRAHRRAGREMDRLGQELHLGLKLREVLLTRAACRAEREVHGAVTSALPRQRLLRDEREFHERRAPGRLGELCGSAVAIHGVRSLGRAGAPVARCQRWPLPIDSRARARTA
jgi:hypothetical protein